MATKKDIAVETYHGYAITLSRRSGYFGYHDKKGVWHDSSSLSKLRSNIRSESLADTSHHGVRVIVERSEHFNRGWATGEIIRVVKKHIPGRQTMVERVVVKLSGKKGEETEYNPDNVMIYDSILWQSLTRAYKAHEKSRHRHSDIRRKLLTFPSYCEMLREPAKSGRHPQLPVVGRG